MKYFFFLIICLPLFSYGQIDAVTEDGYQVQLFEDGTWKYLDITLNEKRFIKENDTLFKAPNTSKVSVNSDIVDIQVKLNTIDWSYAQSPNTEDSEFSFSNNYHDIYGLMIAEKSKIPIENLRNIAIINARDNVKGLKIIQEEYRNVNNVKVLYVCFEGEVEKLSLRYNNYYYSGDDGVVQLITFAEKQVAIANEQNIFKLLNGFVKVQD